MNRTTCEHLVPTDLHCDHCADKQAAVRYITQPEVERLVEDLSYVAKYSDSKHWDTLAEVASELRRLVAQRNALLEALKEIDKEFKKHGRHHWPEAVKARVAIAKAEEA